MNRNQYEIARRARIVAEVAADFSDESPEAQAAIVEDWISDELIAEAQDRAEYLENIEDTPHLTIRQHRSL
jgi:hypothetical protein